MERPSAAETISDTELLQRISTRDDDALSLLYDRYSGLAFSLAYRLLGDRGQAEDVVQEAFLSVWRRAATYDAERGQARGWLVTITRNAAIDRRRGRFRHEHDERNVDDYAYHLSSGSEQVWSVVAQKLDQERVRAALEELPLDQRRILELAYFQGLTQAEIAEQTGTPLGTVKSRARLGLGRLAKILRPAPQKDD
ncbi:sigma-70 family RNA polymerase sigma factor [soil metagenome]